MSRPSLWTSRAKSMAMITITAHPKNSTAQPSTTKVTPAPRASLRKAAISTSVSRNRTLPRLRISRPATTPRATILRASATIVRKETTVAVTAAATGIADAVDAGDVLGGGVAEAAGVVGGIGIVGPPDRGAAAIFPPRRIAP